MLSRIILLTISLLFFSTAQAAVVNGYTATITEYGRDADQALIDHYNNQYGIGIGSVIYFDILIHRSLQGSRTSDTGQVTYLKDSRGWNDTGYVYQSADYSYADLHSISIDHGLVSHGLKRSNYHVYSTHHSEKVGGWRYSNETCVGHYFCFSRDEFVHGYSSDITESFTFSVNDGTGKLRLSGDYAQYTPAPVPLPAAAWMFLSGIGGCCLFRRKSK